MSENSPHVGVYICHCGKNIADVIDINKLVKEASQIPHVAIVRQYKFMCSKAGQELIQDDLKSHKVNRVVVAACSPLMHEPTFRQVLRDVNINEFFFEQANIREQASWVSMHDPEGAFKIARDHIRLAVAKVSQNKPLVRQKFPITQAALIIGGGITGMFASLDLANKYQVYLVEKSPTIGGHMAQLDKTFPTMDCSACILTPKMVEVGRHPNIELLTYAEIESVDLNVGNFEVKVRKKARRINHDICTGCGTCAEVCPVTTPNEFDLNMKHRAAAYIPFPQAVPGQFTIDAGHCIKCGLCVDNCDVNAVDLNQQDEIREFTVGTAIIATGNDVFFPNVTDRYGYHTYQNVIIGLEMERLLSSTGPTLGKVLRPSDKTTPKKIAFLQCVGSRNFREGYHHYCSRVCCMYAIKQARQFKEKYPDAEVYILYIDIRAFGKGYEEFYEIAGREYGINFLRGRIGEIYEDRDKSLIIRGTDTLLGEKYRIKADLLVLSSAIEARSSAETISHLFGIQRSDDGMFMEAHPKLRPVDSLSDGIFIAGTCQSPRDIPDSVAQAKAAASSADNFMALGEIEIDPYYCVVQPSICSGCRSCLEQCPYNAITFNEVIKIAEISPIKCKGCGTCMSTCPSNAIFQNHFTHQQILNELNQLTPWENIIDSKK